VCAEYEQCVMDGGVRASYTDKLENFSSDWNHLNAKGQAAEAKLIWPVVKELLGL
jgi:lysophospholipase L1-like esterase